MRIYINLFAFSLIILQSGRIFGAISGVDSFDTHDSSKWSVEGSGEIQVNNGRAELQLNSGEEAGYKWILNYANKSQTWDAAIDVMLPQSGLEQDEMAGIILRSFWKNPPVPGYSVGLTVEREGFGSNIIEGEYIAEKLTASNFTELDSASTLSTGVSLKIAWDASAELFSFFYDDNGGQDSWTLLTTTGITGWGMNDSDEFGIEIIGWASDADILYSDGLAFDNFSAKTASAIPEPGAIMLFGFLGFPFLTRIKRK